MRVTMLRSTNVALGAGSYRLEWLPAEVEIPDGGPAPLPGGKHWGGDLVDDGDGGKFRTQVDYEIAGPLLDYNGKPITVGARVCYRTDPKHPGWVCSLRTLGLWVVWDFALSRRRPSFDHAMRAYLQSYGRTCESPGRLLVVNDFEQWADALAGGLAQ